MRYITSREENWTWLLLSACWAFGAFVGWFYSLLAESPPVSDGILMLVATVVTVTGLALRLPILTGAPHSDKSWDLMVILTGYLATINWLGLIMLHASSLSAAFGALLIVVSVEIWLLFQFSLYGCLRLAPLPADDLSNSDHRFREESAGSKSQETPLAQVAANATAHAVSNEESTSNTSVGDCPAAEDLGDHETGISEMDGLLRRSVEGLDSQGSRYLSGEILVHLPPQHAAQEVLLGFCPPFVGNPLLEFELSDEFVSANLIRLSPSGACLRVRRGSGTGDSQQELSVELQWYAVQPSQPQLPVPALP